MVTNLVLDAQIYCYQSYGGVTRILDATLPIICELNPYLTIEAISSLKPLRSIPEHQNISWRLIPQHTFRLPYPRGLGRRIEPPINRKIFQDTIFHHYGDGDGAIWHSLYYQTPKAWSGAVIVTILDMAYERFPSLFSSPTHRWFVKHKRDSIQKADAVICISEATRADVLEFCDVPSSKIHVVHLAHDLVIKEKLPETLTNGRSIIQPFILNLGNRSTNKNFLRLLKAFSQWERRHDIPLVVVGKPWSEREMQTLIALGIHADVCNKGQVNDLELAQLYHTASAFVFPSLYEGFGIPLLEAMACGCPVVASQIPSTLEVAGDVPYYFNAHDTEELCDALDKAVSEGRGSSRTLRGVQRAKQFSWERAAEETLRIYERYS